MLGKHFIMIQSPSLFLVTHMSREDWKGQQVLYCWAGSRQCSRTFTTARMSLLVNNQDPVSNEIMPTSAEKEEFAVITSSGLRAWVESFLPDRVFCLFESGVF